MLEGVTQDNSTGTEYWHCAEFLSSFLNLTRPTGPLDSFIMWCTCNPHHSHRDKTPNAFTLIAFASQGRFSNGNYKWFVCLISLKIVQIERRKIANPHIWEVKNVLHFHLTNYSFRALLCAEDLANWYRVFWDDYDISVTVTENCWSPRWCWCHSLVSTTSYSMPCRIQRCLEFPGWSRCTMRCCSTPFR